MTRLLIVSEPGIDGVFGVVEKIIRRVLSEHPEISVDLAYSSRRSGHALRELLADMAQAGCQSIDLNVGNAPGASDMRALLRLVRFARSRGHQIVHAHSSKAGALARIARLARTLPPVIYTPHAYFGMTQSGSFKECLFNTIESLLGRVGLGVCCSEDERDFAITKLHIPPKHLRVIHNGIDTNRFRPPDDTRRQTARATLRLPPDGKLLVTIGRDSFQKNFSPIYEVLDRLLPGSGCLFAHAGAGSTVLRSRLGPEAAMRCFCFDHLEDVTPLLQAADGFVMTSRYEGLSLALLSAMSSGLPCMLTEAPGFLFLKDLAFDEISWLPTPDSSASLTASLQKTLSHWLRSPSATLARQRELVIRHFSEPVQLEKMISQYAEFAVREC